MVPLQRSNDLLQSATVAVRSHEAALASMKGKLAAIHSSTAQRAADNAALLAKQVQILTFHTHTYHTCLSCNPSHMRCQSE